MIAPQTMFRARKSGNFTTFCNALLRDKLLSFKARGVICMVLSNKDDWEVHQNWICERGTEGREAIRSAMQELEGHGYVQHEDLRKGGKIVGTRWTFHEEPITRALRTNRTRWRESLDYGNPQVGEPDYGKPEAGNPEVGNPSTKKDHQKKNHQTENNLLVLKAEAPEKKHRKGHINGSRPTQEMIESFCVSIGLTKRDGEHCFHKWEGNGWTNGGKAIKNWEATIRSWKCQGDILPSQKSGFGAGRQTTPLVAPSGWDQWISGHPAYHAKLAGRTYSQAPEYMQREFLRERKAKKA